MLLPTALVGPSWASKSHNLIKNHQIFLGEDLEPLELPSYLVVRPYLDV